MAVQRLLLKEASNFQHSSIIQPKLSNKYTRLEPIMSSTTLYVLQQKIFQSHLMKLNDIINERQYDCNTLEEFQYHMGAYKNLKLFLENLSPVGEEGGKLINSGLVHQMIIEKWGCYQNFMYEFTQRLNNISCNGWGYLILDGNHLDIITLPDHQMIQGSVELLVISMWDYTYKYDYGDDRRQYLKQIWKTINWRVIEQRIKQIQNI